MIYRNHYFIIMKSLIWLESCNDLAFTMANQEMDDFLEDELISQYVTFPPEVVAALEQVTTYF